MRIATAQINTHIANFEQNYQKIIEYSNKAKDQKCDLVLFPELALFGYWPSDLLERKELVQEQIKYIAKLKKNIPSGIGILFGAVTVNPGKKGKYYHNSAVFLERGKKEKVFHKELLPNYDVFEEVRQFERGSLSKGILKFKGKKFLVTICEDIWGWGDAWIGTRYPKNPLEGLKKLKPDYILNISASPYAINKSEKRKKVVAKTASYFKVPMVYVNQVGGQDEIIFDGGSFSVDGKGKVLSQSLFFEEDLSVIDFKNKKSGSRLPSEIEIVKLRNALVLGIKDYCNKNGFKKIHLGLSGGIDSALVACLACDALGPNRVTTIALPGPFSSQVSFDLALQLAQNLKCQFTNVDINGIYRTAIDEFEVSLGVKEFGLMHENLQSRLRGMTLMAYSNATNSLLLTTGNKSEYAMGYSTLYGDMCGGLAPIGDLLKGQVYDLSHHYNKNSQIIPEEIITRAPTAELRENQKDQDSLPPYPVLDKLVEKFIVNCEPPKNDFEKDIFNRIMRAEFKRWQAAPILKVSDHAFGTGRRYPITWKI
ncbi:MAG: NAD+ synthase [Bdellovibrionota bacterium]